ncbi:uncharacterized protein LOC110837920 [Zootermopsis nevadensis]|uniref:WW domain binding protein VOPP1 n=1 Tax=Zootermopsis nevadensis TaxID=136037 RepID=A0A067QWS3_ZOONE|nr:uncharacterized protein LOC110837920 [Zootermopsis nevadensis]KDR10515.1 hypothetical protein L798_15505 [Zootermopsis nevadensis]
MYVSIAGILALFMLTEKASSKYCDGGHFCSPPKECCTLGCCYMYVPGYRPPAVPPPANIFSIVFWNHWYFWCLLLVLILSCVGVCGLWRRWCFCCWTRGSSRGGSCDDEADASSGESAISCYPPPQYSRCSSFRHAPPPYTEVTSKPDLYPLVNGYMDSGKGSAGGNYLMVQYFRNYIVRPVGSLSATSTADSLSSSFLCTAANEANTIIPPPYSWTGSGIGSGSLDEFQTSNPSPAPPVLLRSASSVTSFNNHNIHCSNSTENLSHQNISSLTMVQQSLPCRSGNMQHQQSFVSATALSTTGSDISSLAGVGTPGSPPRATSPTLGMRELLDKIQLLPFQHEECSDYCVPAVTNSQSDSRTKRHPHRGSGKNLYMPLGLGVAGSRPNKWLPRSAPATPSAHFAPPFFVPPPRPASSGNRRQQSSGATKEDVSPLLAEQHAQNGAM